MSESILKMRNLGTASAQMLAEIDIFDAETLRELGADAVWHRLKFRFGDRLSQNFYYALQGAIEDKDWRNYAKTSRQGKN